MYNVFQTELICCTLPPHKTQDECTHPYAKWQYDKVPILAQKRNGRTLS